MANSNISMTDFAAVSGLANQADSLIEEYNDNVTEFFKIVDEARTIWTGAAAEDSLQKIESRRGDFESLRDSLLGYPAAVRNAVNKHITADQEISSWNAE